MSVNASLAVAVFQLLPHKLKANVLVDQSQQMVFRNLVVQTEVVEQRFWAGVLPHDDQQASEDRNPAQQEKDSYLLPRFR